jgi:hypothetical protein
MRATESDLKTRNNLLWLAAEGVWRTELSVPLHL